MERSINEHKIRGDGQTALEALYRVYNGRLRLCREDITYEGGICVCHCPFLPQNTFVRSLLHAEEQKYFDGLIAERRRRSYFIGRFAAKKAISFLTNEKPKDIHIEYGVFNNPVINSVSMGLRLEISITHSYDLGAAIAFPSVHPMGIDIEQINPEKAEVIEKELTANEKDLCKKIVHSDNYSLIYTIVWTIKESLSKALKTGLMTPLYIYEITNLQIIDSIYVSYFKYFGQYKTVSFMVKNYVCSITFPKRTICEVDIRKIVEYMDK